MEKNDDDSPKEKAKENTYLDDSTIEHLKNL